MRVATLVLCGAAAALAENFQVHTALGKTDDSISVAWATKRSEGTSEVFWGLSPKALVHNAKGDMRHFRVDLFRPWQTRTAVMTNLTVGTTYYYQVGDSVNGFSEIFSVRNRRRAGTGPYYHVLFGDMGSKAAFALCSACTQQDEKCDASTCAKNTTVGLVSEVDKADMMLHVGDFAYNFGSRDGKTGDQFMENIEQIAARVPYMVSHGNHEDAPEALAHYIERFRSQPVNSVPAEYETLNGKAPNTMYFSWNYGMVHYISFSTELFHLPVSAYSLTVTKESFLRWIEKDLQQANLPENRKKFPWILVHGHRPLYSSAPSGSDETVRAALEDMFFRYGVSFSVNGHQHDYERSWPTYKGKSDLSYVDPKAPIYIVTGAAGSKEMHTPFAKDQPSWSAFRSNTFGYTRMIVHNETHAHFQQVRTDPIFFPLSGYGDIIDDFWVVQRHQGPFNPSSAPKQQPVCPAGLCRSYDHFDPILRPMLGASGTSEPLHKVIQQYRHTQGEVAWVRKLKELLARVNGKAANVEWEDGLFDSKEESALQWIDEAGNDQ